MDMNDPTQRVLNVKAIRLVVENGSGEEAVMDVPITEGRAAIRVREPEWDEIITSIRADDPRYMLDIYDSDGSVSLPIIHDETGRVATVRTDVYVGYDGLKPHHEE